MRWVLLLAQLTDLKGCPDFRARRDYRERDWQTLWAEKTVLEIQRDQDDKNQGKEHQWEDSFSENEPPGTTEGLPPDTDKHSLVHGCEKTTHGWGGKKQLKYIDRAVPRAHPGPEILTATTSQSRKPHSSRYIV